MASDHPRPDPGSTAGSDLPPPPPEISLRIGGAEVTIREGHPYVIGSAPGCDVRLGHSSISPQHARLSLVNGQILIDDLDSTTGIWIGERRLEAEQVLLPGMAVRLGSIELHLGEDDPPAGAVAGAEIRPGDVRIARAAAVPLSERHRDNESFSEIMADVLRGTPWYLISTAVHVLVIWLLIVLWPPEEEGSGYRVTLVVGDSEESFEELLEGPPDELFEIEKSDELETIEEPEDDFRIEGEDEPDDEAASSAALLDDSFFGDNSNVFSLMRGSGGDDVLTATKGKISRGFTSTVRDLRNKGLEIVFVFDSTGSMGPVLDETKRSLGRMVQVLHSLVPGARIGIVTFRDKGQDEEYVTRHVPLSGDFFRSINFVQTISAEGGGDRPEAVYEGLRLASSQRWSPKARRVIVLIGDAPPHRKTLRQIDGLTKSFARNGRSFVHSITTSPDVFGSLDPDVVSTYARIAKGGRGQSIPFNKEGQILRDVLSLAFGREERQSVNEIYAEVERREARISPAVRRMVEDTDLTGIERAFKRRSIPADLVRAIIASRKPALATLMLDILRDRESRPGARHAAAHAIQRILELDLPPIDADRSRPLGKEVTRYLEGRIEKLLDE